MNKKQSEHTLFRMPIKLRDELKTMAKEMGFTMVGLVNHLVQNQKGNKK